MTSSQFTLLKTSEADIASFHHSQSLLEKNQDFRELVKKLKLPEELCEKKAQKLTGEVTILFPDDPLFSKINRRIALIEKRVKNATDTAKESLENILGIYKRYPFQYSTEVDRFYAKHYPDGPQKEHMANRDQHFSDRYIVVRSRGTELEQVYCLEKNAEKALKQREFHKAAKLLNAALAIAKEKNLEEFHIQSLFEKLEGIRALFLQSIGKEPHWKDVGRIEDFQARLLPIRARAQKSLQTQSIQSVMEQISKDYQKLFMNIIHHGIAILGEPPTKKYAFIGLDSMARDEMCPRPALPFAILLKVSDEDSLQYFRNLCKLIELEVINMGETPVKAFEMDESPILAGFYLHPQYTPLSNSSFIGTPNSFLRILMLNLDKIALLSHSCTVVGDESLTKDLKSKIGKALKEKLTGLSQKYHEILGMRMLADLKSETSIPELQIPRSDDVLNPEVLLKSFEKQLSSLEILYQFKAKNHFAFIDTLVEKNVFSFLAAVDLKEAYASILKLCVKHQLSPPQKLEEYQEKIEEILKTLIPFRRVLENAISKETISFPEGRLRDEDHTTLGEIELRFHNIEMAMFHFESAIERDPSQFRAHMLLTKLQSQRQAGQPQDPKLALTRAEAGVRISQKKHGETAHPEIGEALTELGMTHFRQGKYEIALTNFINVLRTYERSFHNQSHRLTATAHFNIGSTQFRLKNYSRACDSYEAALKMREELSGNRPDVEVALTHHSLGLTYQAQGTHEEARKAFVEALSMYRRIYGETSHQVARTMNHVAKAHRFCGAKDEALTAHGEALEVLYSIEGKNPHKDICWVKGSLGMTLKAFGQLEDAIAVWRGAEKDYESLNQPNQQIKESLRDAYRENGQEEMAKEYEAKLTS